MDLFWAVVDGYIWKDRRCTDRDFLKENLHTKNHSQKLKVATLIPPQGKVRSEPLNQAVVELVSRAVRNAAVRVLFIKAIYVQHQAELLHGRTQVNWLGLISAKLKSDEVAFTKNELRVLIVLRLLTKKGSRMDP